MFSFFKKKNPPKSVISNLSSVILPLQGLHCSSCALSIDMTLEELPSVESKTNYAKSECTISYDPSQTSIEKIKSTIADLGYKVTQ